jgi:hypothetical protein
VDSNPLPFLVFFFLSLLLSGDYCDIYYYYYYLLGCNWPYLAVVKHVNKLIELN